MKALKEYFKNYSLSNLYIQAFQLFSILPVIYIFTASGYPGLLAKNNFLSFLFELGINTVSRAQAIALSLIYRKTSSEVIICFVLLFFALFFGIAAEKLLNRYKIGTRLALAIYVGADLIIRIIPFSFNTGFGKEAIILGFIIRAFFLAMIIIDVLRLKKFPNNRGLLL